MIEVIGGAGYEPVAVNPWADPPLQKKMTPADVRRAASLLEQRRELHQMISSKSSNLVIDDVSKWLRMDEIIENAKPALQTKVEEISRELRELGVELDL
jgi:hypothetical protein